MKEKKVFTALGAMSGTSLDGVDAAVVVTDGFDIFGFGETAYRAYSDAERFVLRAALGSWDAPQAARVVEDAHIEALSGIHCDVIGFHGQTFAHAPDQRRTYQAGDGERLADALKRDVVWDFRSADVALGGQGAPLAPFFHHACARWAGLRGPVAFLNLGGVANITWLDPNITDPAAPGAVLAFDTGPASAPMNDIATTRLGTACDLDGAGAAAGRGDTALVARWMDHPFFATDAPKSLDRDAFDLSQTDHLSVQDALATTTEFAAQAVAAGFKHLPSAPAALYLCGGGRKNPTLVAAITDKVPCDVHMVEDLGLDGDMLEAQAFGYLAVRVMARLPTSAPGTTGVAAAVAGGNISQPEQRPD